MTHDAQLREELIEYSQRLGSSGLSVGKSGNLSVRNTQGFLITPSGLGYDELQPADIVQVDHDGRTANQPHAPSSEWRFHYDIYCARSDVHAIVHAHPTYSTALACTGRAIPAFHYMVAVTGAAEIPIAPYALFGTQALSDAVVSTLQNGNACLMQNHGMLTVGATLSSTFALAQEVEELAKQYCEALKLGEVKLLSDQQMAEALEKFKGYGQRV